MMTPKFELGRIVATSNALAQILEGNILAALCLHVTGDWGELDEHDRQENERSLREGGRLMSVYRSGTGVKFWIITEADRSVTTVLLPEDY